MSFPRYPQYKASEVEWLGDVPKHWKVDPMFGCASERYESNRGMLVDNLLSLSYGRIISKDVMTNEGLLPDSFETYQIVRRGDIVFRLTDLQNDKRSLRTALVEEDGIITSAYLTIAPRGPDSRFMAYLCRAYDLTKVFYSMGGGVRQTMKFADMKRLPIVLPPLPEQTAIAEFLDRETGKIDELVAEQRRLMELLKEKITSLVLSSMDLPNTKRMRLGNAATLISRPVLQQQDESYTRIGVFNRGRGLFHKDASEMDDMGESDFFWIEEGDLIISGQFAWEGAVAMAGKAETGCVVSHRYPVIRGIPGVALTEYLFGLLCTNHGDFLLNENSRGAAGRNRPLNIRSLLKERIPVPSMQIQETVARAIHSRAVLFHEISNAIDLLQERRTALISAAVTGQIDVRQTSKN
jgi:type I restriction enzyme S subunit